MELLTGVFNIPNGSQTFIPSFDENQIFSFSDDPKALRLTIALLNTKLNSTKTRREAIIFLNLLLSQTRSLDSITEFSNIWIFHCLKECQTDSSNSDGFKLLRKLILLAKKSPDLKTHVSQQFGDIVKLILSKDGDIPVLQCLEACLVDFPGPCGYHRNAIEKKLISLIDIEDPRRIRYAARCLHLLQQVSGGSTQGINHKIQWSNQQEKICGTLHYLINEIYGPLTNMFEITNRDMDHYDLPEISGTEILTQMTKLSTRFSNIIQFLKDMLINPFPVVKSINVNMIFQVITKGLSISCEDLKDNPTLDASAIGIIIPKIHKAIFELLEALFLGLRSNLFPHSMKICKYFVKALEWSKKSDGFIPYRAFKVTVYKSLNTWLSISKGTSCIQNYAKELVPLLLEDCKPVNEEMGNKVQLLKTGKSKKKMNKIVAESCNKLQGGFNDDLGIRAELITTAALTTLQNIIKSVGVFLEVHYHKVIQEFVVKALLEEQKNNSIYYKDPACRLELYRILQTLATNPHPITPPPLQYALHIFSIGQHDQNHQISKFCTESMIILEKIIHPASVTLNYPREYLQNMEFLKPIMPLAIEEKMDVEEVDTEDEVEVETEVDGNGVVVEEDVEIASVVVNLSDDESHDDVVEIEETKFVDKDEEALRLIEIIEEKEINGKEDELFDLTEGQEMNGDVGSEVELVEVILKEKGSDDEDSLISSFVNVTN